MKLNNALTDATVLKELGRRLARARIAASLTQADLADRASVGKRTVERIEAGGSVQLVSLIRVLRALNLLETLDVMTSDEGPGPMEMLERRGKVRRRVSSSRKAGVPDPTATPWVWGDER
jgi:transcriptional regulator with XRE-family HTH domain